MNCTECGQKLHAYIDAELSAGEAEAFAAHLAQCPSCQAKVESLRTLRREAARLEKEIAPRRDLWSAIAAEIGATETAVIEQPATKRGGAISFLAWLGPLATAAAIAFFAMVAERGATARDARSTWAVANLAGAPRIDATAFQGEARFRVGQWLETDAASRAKIAVGSVGEVTVDPNSRLRLAATAATDHRLELTRGSVRAFISAPPRIFFVDTPSATAVDLGCAYTLAVDDNGDGELRVTLGYVALEHGERQAFIPAGAVCLTRRGAGPGTPFVNDAGVELQAALKRFDFEPGAASTVLPWILAQVRSEDAVTLWHLLARTEGPAREAVYAALVRYHLPPAGVTKEGILAGNAGMRREWAIALGLGSALTLR